MSITDELRVGGIYKFPAQRRSFTEEELTAIADRIDEKVASEYVRLPKDADDKVIHIGDVMDGYNKTIEVAELRYGHGGWVLISKDGNGYADTFAFAHHHEPTVEDVLRDVVTLCHNTWKEGSITGYYDVDDVMNSGNITELAKRIREAVEHERD